jgi:hypothetical protein
MSPAERQFFRYHGSSMRPIFQEGDLLEVERVPFETLRRGDCIVFRNGTAGQVVHRVVAAGATLQTRGDAIGKIDCGAVTPESLLGRVVRRYRLGVGQRVRGGWMGLLVGRFCGLAGRIDPLGASRGGRLGRRVQKGWLTVFGGMKRPGRIETLVLPDRSEVKVWYWGQLVIGRHDPPRGEWVLYWPWRLLFTAPQGAERG